MTMPHVLMTGPLVPLVAEQLDSAFPLHRLWQAHDPDRLMAEQAKRIEAIATGDAWPVDSAFMGQFPNLKLVAKFGVGYDTVDAAWAGQHGIVVTNTPDVLTEEVADTTLGLILMTVRQLSQAERYLRAGRWAKEGHFPLTRATLRSRTVGILGLGRIGKAVAQRLDAFSVPVVYHGRRQQTDVAYRYYADLVEMARDVDILVVVAPGGPKTRRIVDARVLDALGPDGILINVARGSLVDEAALITALREGRILSAGLDVFETEPHVPAELIEMDQVVLLPHVGSASVHTRNQMAQLVVDNIKSFFEMGKPLTPVPETPVR
jgi:lactate dehydrogenase-like 2-hydroxyacid dehydrogenase